MASPTLIHLVMQQRRDATAKSLSWPADDQDDEPCCAVVSAPEVQSPTKAERLEARIAMSERR
eukprot:CAMPEP_0168485584 /NCGR_PEP_ID=MMETSP0228-20121227/66684_1 /TAXON_ID=133427 /ORGANISM="Protoceratium reticulatum, Strain CCCM 535 (=CCMP 1889)" /LENGTH=62 /DNA_ID=CAMNT_0008502151 /DNA_START=52 /DNA_END=236 /DNA_ORIENTATION=-